MSGSSKFLFRALNNFFERWTEEEEEDLSKQRDELSEAITLYLAKHNTLSSIRQATHLNNELFRLYDQFVNNSVSIKSSILFLEILSSLSSVLNQTEVSLWLNTYLGPAVDSAGLQISFVEKATDFIRSVSVDSKPTDDAALAEQRDAVGTMVMDRILQLYVGGNDSRYEIIHLYFSEEEKNTQVLRERMRFIKLRTKTLLTEYGLRKPFLYFNLINRYFISSPKDRLPLITLLSYLFVSQERKLGQIIHNELFESLLKSLMYDYSESLLLVTVSLLVLIIPLMVTDVSGFLPDLFFILSRLISWDATQQTWQENTNIMESHISKEKVGWKQVAPMNDDSDVSASTSKTPQLALEISYFATLLYGAFPLNFIKFCESPLEYILSNEPRLFRSSLFIEIDNSDGGLGPRDKSLNSIVRSRTINLLKSFTLHPSIIRGKQSLQSEVSSPLFWIAEEMLEEESGAGSSPERIAVSFLSLNPNLMTSVPEYLDDTMASSGISPEVEKGPLTLMSRHKRSMPTSQASLGNIANMPKDVNSSGQALSRFRNFDRKFSVVPTDMFVENLQKESFDVKFKDVKFRNAREDSKTEVSSTTSNNHSEYSQPESPKLSTTGWNSSTPLNELLHTHEKLYVPSSNHFESDNLDYVRSSESNTLESFRNEYSKPVSSTLHETAYVPTSVNNSEVAGSAANSFGISTISKDSKGTAIDFYQRELLLSKNELEFRSYIKNLNKFNYVSTKLRLNRLENKEAIAPYKYFSNVSRTEYEGVLLKLKELQLQLEHKDIVENDGSSQQLRALKSLKEENRELSRKLNLISVELQSKTQDSSQLIVALDEKAHFISKLEMQLQQLKREQTSVRESKDTSGDLDLDDMEARLKRMTDNYKTSEERYNSQEANLYALRNEILQQEEEKHILAKQLKDLHESYDLLVKTLDTRSEDFKRETRDVAKSLTTNYEKKIQELYAAVKKYEVLLEEKNSEILQMSISKPVKIPSREHYPSNLERPHIDVSFSAGSSSSHSSQGIDTPRHNLREASAKPALSYRNSQPIIKGRGGYQKRSKMFM